MKILLLSATPFEIAPCLLWLEQHEPPGIRSCIGGVGPVATAWNLAHALQAERPDLVIQAGIGGAIDRRLQIGEVVHVVSERFADLGVEEADGRFTDLFELGLLEPATPPFVAGRLNNLQPAGANFLPGVQGITVSKAHGSAASIEALRAKYPDAQLESMEGAALFYGCLLSGVSFLEIRGVSNYVEPRNREGWNLPLAIDNLNAVLIEILQTLLQA